MCLSVEADLYAKDLSYLRVYLLASVIVTRVECHTKFLYHISFTYFFNLCKKNLSDLPVGKKIISKLCL